MNMNITQADVREARRLMAKMAEVEDMIGVQKACHLDCTEDEQLCQTLKEFLTDFLEVFGPKFPKA